jgi:immune inhibitor A
MNADSTAKLEINGDDMNSFPSKLRKREFTATTSPNSKSYAGQDTFVLVRNISGAGRTMRTNIMMKPQTNNPGRTSKL